MTTQAAIKPEEDEVIVAARVRARDEALTAWVQATNAWENAQVELSLSTVPDGAQARVDAARTASKAAEAAFMLLDEVCQQMGHPLWEPAL